MEMRKLFLRTDFVTIKVIFTIFALVCLPAHLHILAAGPPSEYEDVFDFGTASMESDEIRSTFVISNHGNDTLKIKNAHSPCHLVQVLSYPQEIPPHENAHLELRLIPSKPGEVKCEILLETKNSPNGILRYALKGIIEGEISGVGKNRPDPDIPPGLITRKLRKRDPALAISVETVLRKLKKKEGVVLVDVRNREEFEKFRIPGSINMPLFSIKTKSFLKSQSLVLINEGYHYGPLEQECKQLRDSGFNSVWVLNGGLNVWKESGAPLNGDIFVQKELNRMPPQVFFEEKNDENWLLIDVSKPKNPESRYLIPQAIAIPFVDDAEQCVSSIKRAMGRDKTNRLLSLLIFDERGEQYERVEKLIEEAGLRSVFYLKGGLKGYKTFLQRQALIWQPKEHSTKTLKKCASCP